ncbi:flagellar assembly protein FlgT [Alteromonas sp. ASW11-19]|uniref:Flagellar assembly protein FlgT n=1 Tax=Alteromonas salexigens TaxID=2982530 RepID=A0ABT2VNR9_9ALTE|nr:flagella assembly protein FlgT [Alteromonas salexigens]MCU7554956.1 flagellar assembly protein FlgT [Alteromonas salexigens]
MNKQTRRLRRHINWHAALFCLLTLPAWQSSAAWFEATGQAVIVNDNKEQARQQATEEALQQAVLFAGASVSSVQTLTNGLLSDDRLQISATGEVAQVELVHETWHDEYVSVRVRADIFPQANQCTSADHLKTLATTHYPIVHREQAQDGQLHPIGEMLATRLQRHFRHFTENVTLKYIAPYSAQWNQSSVVNQAPVLARQSKSQYVLAGMITDLSVDRPTHSSLAFWKDGSAYRHFGFSLRLLDGMNGGALLEKEYTVDAAWDFDRFAEIDVASAQFWQSHYGMAIDDALENVVRDISDAVACQPLTGRVLQVAGQRVEVSLGRDHGLQVGDELYLYQTRQINDVFGETYVQYNVYPGKVKVTNAYADTATVEPVDGVILANIQPNDFVAKR